MKWLRCNIRVEYYPPLVKIHLYCILVVIRCCKIRSDTEKLKHPVFLLFFSELQHPSISEHPERGRICVQCSVILKKALFRHRHYFAITLKLVNKDSSIHRVMPSNSEPSQIVLKTLDHYGTLLSIFEKKLIFFLKNLLLAMHADRGLCILHLE